MPANDVVDSHLHRLAIALKLDFAQLKAQWQDIFPRAHFEATSGTTNRAAWRTVVNRLTSRQALKNVHPPNVLQTALIAYCTFCPSTSGVEQKFSKASLRFTSRQEAASTESEEMYLKVCLDFPERDATAICNNAQQVWKHCYGQHRIFQRRMATRLDKGTKRKASEAELPTEKSFLAKRRSATKNAVSAAVSAASAASAAPAESAVSVGHAPGPDWSDSHEKELSFLRKKCHDKVLDAFAEKCLLPCESTPAVQADAAAKHKKRVADHQAMGA